MKKKQIEKQGLFAENGDRPPLRIHVRGRSTKGPCTLLSGILGGWRVRAPGGVSHISGGSLSRKWGRTLFYKAAGVRKNLEVMIPCNLGKGKNLGDNTPLSRQNGQLPISINGLNLREKSGVQKSVQVKPLVETENVRAYFGRTSPRGRGEQAVSHALEADTPGVLITGLPILQGGKRRGLNGKVEIGGNC